MADTPTHAGLRALFVNTSLKKAPEDSHTKLLLNASANIMEGQGVAVEHLHLLSHDVPPGVQPDMTEQGWDRDDWPALWPKVLAADILVVGTPIWLGEESSVCRVLIERLYAMSAELNERGQSVYYGKVAGVIVTGNEDGVKHVAMGVNYALNHLGYTIPPQADAGWIGEIGPGPSYGDEMEDGSRAGFDSAFTRRNTTILSWNLMHLARLLKPGIPNQGNDRNALSEGVELDHENPEYRS